MGNHNGYKVIGPNGNYIFLPAAGYRVGTILNGSGSGGSYWASSPYDTRSSRTRFSSVAVAAKWIGTTAAVGRVCVQLQNKRSASNLFD